MYHWCGEKIIRGTELATTVFPRLCLLQNYLDHNRDYHFVGVRLSMSRPSEIALEPACKNDNVDVTPKPRRVSRCHYL